MDDTMLGLLQFKAYKPKTYLLYGYWITIDIDQQHQQTVNGKAKIAFLTRNHRIRVCVCACVWLNFWIVIWTMAISSVDLCVLFGHFRWISYGHILRNHPNRSCTTALCFMLNILRFSVLFVTENGIYTLFTHLKSFWPYKNHNLLDCFRPGK